MPEASTRSAALGLSCLATADLYCDRTKPCRNLVRRLSVTRTHSVHLATATRFAIQTVHSAYHLPARHSRSLRATLSAVGRGFPLVPVFSLRKAHQDEPLAPVAPVSEAHHQHLQLAILPHVYVKLLHSDAIGTASILPLPLHPQSATK